MKIANILAGLKATILRLRLVLGISLAVVLLAVGGAYGWKTYKFRQGPEYALQNLNKALLAGKKEDMARMVDFRALATHLAATIYGHRPRTPAQGTRDQSVMWLADEVQRVLLTALEPAKDDKAPPAIPRETPLAPLPANFSAQLAGKLTVQSQQEGTALAVVTINYGRVEKDFPLRLLMENKPDGWRVTKLANADEVVTLFAQSERYLQDQRDQALKEKNDEQLGRMNAQMEIRSCTAATQRLSDKKTILLSTQIVAFNRGAHTIHNMNLLATFTPVSAPDKHSQRRINIAVRMPPGEHMTHTYNAELNLDNPEDAALAAAGPLQCTISPSAMALSSGEVLYLREKPAP